MVLPDVLAPDLDIVFCGTAVGSVSARRRAYYAGPGNAFWPTLHRVGLTDRLLQPEEYEKLLDSRIGLTDLAKEISGNDGILSRDHFNADRLKAIIRQYRPRILAFTGKRAAQEYFVRRVEYGLLAEREGETMFFVLTSPSGAACRYWSIEPWQELADWRNGRQCDLNRTKSSDPNLTSLHHVEQHG
jgi:double-stranded uracil-DNA glycosylase